MNTTAPRQVPAPPTPLIGRAAEMAALRERLLHRGARLVTLTGPPGVGKTALAADLAASAGGDFADGAIFVPLDAIREAGLVPSALAGALALREEPGRTLAESVVATLAGRRMLIVLDNFEQVIEAAAFVADLLGGCPSLSLVVTSRTPLHLRAEQQQPVEPLATRGDGGRGTGDRDEGIGNGGAAAGGMAAGEIAPAVALFVERAQAVRPAFALTAENAADVAAICTALDGLPLAIELAAARVSILSIREIVQRLSERLALLTGGYRDLPERHRTLRAAIDWSYDLLSPDEQRLFRLLALFRGGATLDALLAVADDAPASDAEDALLALVGGLTDQSLLRRGEDGDGTSRFRMLETIRDHALDGLTRAGEAEGARLRLAGWQLTLAELAHARIAGPEQPTWLARLDAEHDNLRASLDWSLPAAQPGLGLQLAASLWRYWQIRGLVSEGRGRLAAALAARGTAPAAKRASAHYGAAALALDAGDLAEAFAEAERCNRLAREAGDDQLTANVILFQAALAWRGGDYATAADRVEESLAIARSIDLTHTAARSLNMLGLLDQNRGDFAAAQVRFEEALALGRQMGDRSLTAIVLSNLGLNAHRQEEYARARPWLVEALALNRQIGDRTEISRNLIMLAIIMSNQADLEGAYTYALESLAMAEEAGSPNSIAEALTQLINFSRRRGDLRAARAFSVRHLEVARRLRFSMQMLSAVNEAATTAHAAGQAGRALRLRVAAEAYRELAGIADYPSMARENEEQLQSLRDTLGGEAFAATWAAGAAMSIEEAIEFALTEEPAAEVAPAAPSADQSGAMTAALPDGLTTREAEVLRLIAAGRSNSQIAERLVVSRRTVEHHLANIYAKIGASGRVDAAAYALRQGLASEE